MNEVRFADLFNGVDGFRLGLERANSSLDTEFTAGEGGHKNKEGRRADLRGKNGNGGREHTDGSFRCVWSCDNNKYANQIHYKNYGRENHYPDDVQGVNPEEIPDFDLLCAGFPCQAFSVAGKRKGFQDTRGTLFFEICRIAEAKRPALLLLENVKGLLNHDRGRTFTVVLQSLDDLGYWVEWQVLNSKHFGVPQNRERVFVVGHLRGTGGREVFPIAEDDPGAGEGDGEEEVGKPASSVIAGYDKQNMRDSYIVNQLGLIDGKDSQANRIYSNKGISPTLPTPGGGRHIPKFAIPVLTPDRIEKRQHGRRFKEDGEPAFTLTQQDVHGVLTVRLIPEDYREKGNYLPRERVLSENGLARAISTYESQHPFYQNKLRIRRLTPVECERLQGFPDDWTKYGYLEGETLDYENVYGWRDVETEPDGDIEKRWVVVGKRKLETPLENTVLISDTQRYKCLGNAVTVNVIEFLGGLIRDRCFQQG